MAGSPSPIQTFFSRAPGPCSGRSKLSKVEAELEGVDVANVVDAAGAPGLVGVSMSAGRRGRSADLGMVPNVTT